MKLYIMDCGVYGSIIVVSDSEANARELMQTQWNYDDSIQIKEHEIVNGFIFANLGDK
jgi:metal-responsive CopG/Arc/MetJ family transcriptional regulator